MPTQRSSDNQRAQRSRAKRAENVASWYFRLNGFLSISGFIVHPDVVRDYPRTEADLIAARFPYSQETIGGRRMADDRKLTGLSHPPQVLFLLMEVKTDLCRINGPWTDPEADNMHRVIRRLGFVDDSAVATVANAMYSDLRWVSQHAVLQYVAVGGRFNDGLQRQFGALVQITWNEMADFFFQRCQQFPEKLPRGRRAPRRWPERRVLLDVAERLFERFNASKTKGFPESAPKSPPSQPLLRLIEEE